jgi:peptidoglycan/xylan/chitin deacetylase (PgdA/CDA1 family)
VTIDDGYSDQGDIACPILIDFDCPATIFVTSGFLDGDLWFWWDQIGYILVKSEYRRVSLEVPSGTLDLDLADRNAVAASRASLERVCKAVPNDVRLELIERLARLAGVDVPAQAPASHAPMSWDDVRRLERSGIGFGPHTVTHPILSRTTDAQSRREIATSWERLCAEAAHPVDVFCYPNGQADDFSDREVATIRELGLSGAVTGMDGYITRDSYGRADQRYRLPRFAFPEDPATLTQYVNGLEFAKTRIRRAR